MPGLGDKVEEGGLVVGRDEFVVLHVEASLVDLIQWEKTVHGEEIHQLEIGVQQLSSLRSAESRVVETSFQIRASR